jgi:hypothetical protein
MFIYWGKRVESEHVGGRVVRVECTMCGCEYFYVMTRIGSGSGTAPYGVGVAGATRSAQEQSQRDLGQRLVLEAELVPCPKCNWINDELVQGYRLGRYRGVDTFAPAVGIVGAAGALICAWFISIGPAADRPALPYFLFGGPTLFIFLAAGMILLQNWMRSRIQPNRDFPLTPRLPPGSPPALLREPSSGVLMPAKPGHSRVSVASDWHDFQIGRHELPLLCCGCLRSPTPEHGYKCQLTATMELEIPRCEDCAGDARRAYRRIWWSTAVLGQLGAGAIVAALRLESFAFWLILGGSVLISLALASFVSSMATAPVKVAGGDRARGVVRLRFRNTDYGQVVAKQLSDIG